jgi:alkaline phosphatase
MIRFVHYIPFVFFISFQGCAHETKQVSDALAYQKESPKWWYQQGEEKVKQLLKESPYPQKAKNVILFLGDGMNISTITAARILQGQQRGESGEENQLSFEKFPQTALAKTYNTNQQTADSAGTMSAIMTGVKTKSGVISVDGMVDNGDCHSGKGHHVMTLLEMAEKSGMATGVVTTARLTHATPAATYAHSVSRHWEADSDIPRKERNKACKDIARQLIEFPYGDGLEVAMGGGRINYLPRELADPEYSSINGKRLDKRNLMDEWNSKYKNAITVWNKKQFDAINVNTTQHLLGLFEPGHMQYEHDKPHDKAGEPTLSEMTATSLAILKNSKKPFFLMIEAGRIDHGHHAGNAYRALTETVELSDTVEQVLQNIDLNETLVIVTADHSHTFNIAGYPQRGNPILGLVKTVNSAGNPSAIIAKDAQNKPYTTLSYANGPGYVNGDKRPDLTHVDVESPDYKQAAIIPRESETHSGEDVVIYATGAGSQSVHGTLEQNVIFHIMKYVLELKSKHIKK